METVRSGRFNVPILYEDNHLLVAVKPPNLLSQADDSRDDDILSILKRHIAEKYRKPGAVYLGLVHRLDRPVGGVMVFARTSKAAGRLGAAFREHEQNRNYLAVLQGELREKRRLEDFLIKDARTGMVRVVPDTASGAKRAVLESEPLCTRNGLTLTKVTLHTGRSHQIRVQHAHIGLPLWGDARYGGGKPGQQIALWAYRLCIEHPTRHETLEFVQMPPSDGIWTTFEHELIERRNAHAESLV